MAGGGEGGGRCFSPLGEHIIIRLCKPQAIAPSIMRSNSGQPLIEDNWSVVRVYGTGRASWRERETEKEKHLCLSFFICLFVCSPVVFGVPARDQIQDTMVTYAAASTMQDPLTHYTGLGIEPASWCCRDAADPIVP